jgi:hypothetical protein
MCSNTDALQAQYDELQLAIGTGAKVVRFQDRTVEYQSTDQMIKAANYLYSLLNPGGGTGSLRQIRFYTGKGL